MNIEHQKIDSRQGVYQRYQQVSVDLIQELCFDGPLTSHHATNPQFHLLCSILATPSKSITDWGEKKPIWFRVAANLRGDGGRQCLPDQALGRIAALLLHAPAVPLSDRGDYSVVYARRNCRLAALAILQVILGDDSTTRAAASLAELTPRFKMPRLQRCCDIGLQHGTRLLRAEDSIAAVQVDPLGLPRWDNPAYALAFTLGLYGAFYEHVVELLSRSPGGGSKNQPASPPWLASPFLVHRSVGFEDLKIALVG